MSWATLKEYKKCMMLTDLGVCNEKKRLVQLITEKYIIVKYVFQKTSILLSSLKPSFSHKKFPVKLHTCIPWQIWPLKQTSPLEFLITIL